MSELFDAAFSYPRVEGVSRSWPSLTTLLVLQADHQMEIVQCIWAIPIAEHRHRRATYPLLRKAHMTISEARTWLIGASLSICAANVVFFLIAPTIGYPLTSEQATQLLQIIIPVFTGYLGSAVHFVFRLKETSVLRAGRGVAGQFALLVRGPIALFTIWVAAAIVSFGISNRADATPGMGMSVDTLAGNLTAALALLTATTNAIVAYVFGSPPDQK